MEEFVKYMTPNDEDLGWGIHINAAGKINRQPGGTFQHNEHPNGYKFTWVQGRILNEYQICYITEGKGIYENKFETYELKSGSLMIIKPGIWHRYRPLETTGWHSNFIGFSGKISNHFLDHSTFSNKVVLDLGYHEELIDTYYKIFECILEERPGFQQVATGEIIKLLGLVIAFDKHKEFSCKGIEAIIQNSKFIIRENINSNIDFKAFAESNNICYQYFRKMFKKYTGLAPIQYHLNLKILTAKEMLLHTDKLIKEISAELGFQSIYYFHRLFKKKLGVTPKEIRKNR